MKNFILSLIATIVVMIVTPVNPNIIADSPQFIKEYKPLSTLEAPVYAQKQKMVTISTPKTSVSQGAPSSSCNDWLAQAGITDGDAIWLISKESGCNPNAQNPKSTAYGIFQFLDSTWTGVGCTKTSDPIQQIICGQKYVMARYGSWSNAKAFWQSHSWY